MIQAQITHAPQANSDLEDIYGFSMAMWGQDRATEYLLGLRAIIENLAVFPEMGKAKRHLGVNMRAFVHESHHVVYDRVSEDEILILRVVHSRRRLTRRILLEQD